MDQSTNEQCTTPCVMYVFVCGLPGHCKPYYANEYCTTGMSQFVVWSCLESGGEEGISSSADLETHDVSGQ